jgi:hypothetical protein
MKKYRPIVGLGVLALVAAAQGAWAAEDPLRISRPVHATKFDLNPGRTYLAPHLAVDPSDDLHVLAAISDVRTKRCSLMRSTDGGQTWSLVEGSPSPASYPFCLMTNSHTFQGKVLFGSKDTIYYALSGWDNQDVPRRSVFLARSTDLGRNWVSTPVADARPTRDEGTHDNRPISGFAVDTSGAQDAIHVAWRRQFPNSNPRLANQAMVASSQDGGRTFGEPINLSDLVWNDNAKRDEAVRTAPTPSTTVPSAGQESVQATTSTTSTTVPAPAKNNFGGSNPTAAVDSKGTVYVAWVTVYSGLTNTPRTAHFLAKSTDRGKTFTSVGPITPFVPDNTNNFGGMVLAWSPKGGPDGSLHFVYEGSKRPEIENENDVFYRRSTDGGRTWTDAKVLNDDPPDQLRPQLIPNISVAPNGRLDAVWWDTRDDPGLGSNDVYYASSTDNGETWTKNARITDESINRKIGPFASNFDLNSPPGLASTNAFAVIGWDDTRFGNEVTETSDIFSAAVQYKAVGGTSKVLTYVLSGVVGLLVVGLILTLAALASRRRQGPAPRAPAGVGERQPAEPIS